MSTIQIPQTDSITELAQFWDSHSVADFEDQLEEVTEPVFNRESLATVFLPSVMASDKNEFTTIDPQILHGSPLFKGTQIPVKTLFNYLMAGDSLKKFLDDFPAVKREYAEKALGYSLVASGLE